MNSEFEPGGTYALLYAADRDEEANFAFEALNGFRSEKAREGDAKLEKMPYGLTGGDFRWKLDVPLWGSAVFQEITEDSICQCKTNNECDEWGWIAAVTSIGVAAFFLAVLLNNARKQFILYYYVRDYEVSEYPIQPWQKSRHWGLYLPGTFMIAFFCVSLFFYWWRQVF
jgi:hypothetical protein